MILGLVVVVAGCVSPWADDDGDGVGGDGASGRWSVGEEWHYRGENGVWQNRTVEGIEERHGHQLYRVEVAWSRAYRGSSSLTYWFNTTTLATIAGEQMGVYAWAECTPRQGIYPLEDKQMSCKGYTRDSGYYGNTTIEINVTEAETLALPSGSFVATHYNQTTTDRYSTYTYRYWFNRTVENHVQFEAERGDFDGKVLFELVEWTGGN